MGWAGPLATRTLADLGADVIKIEACQYPDWWRGVDNRPAAMAEMRHEKTGRFIVMNRNKRGITLDLTTPEGVAIVRRLVADADAVVENYSTGVLPKLGLSYAHLREVNPSLVMASMSAFGSTGPWKECRAYGSTLEHGSGLPRLVGEPDALPTMGHLAFGDAIGGLNATVALMAALLHRKRTGEGQHIDISQVECMLPFTAVPMMLQSVTGATPERTGNRHPGQAPHGVFPCAGVDRWVTVAVADDAQWLGLCAAIGRHDLLADPALRTLAGRQAQQAMLEDAIAAWTLGRDPAAAMAGLQAHGVAAGAVVSPGRLHEDPHLVARRFWQWRDRAVVGLHPQASLAFRVGSEPYAVRSPAPTLGQHTEAVLTELLGMSAAELAALAEAEIIGTRPAATRRRVVQPA
jgi:crotonobetainyl-CoA:carnitine CoA-transferase CaiB-like acyl-CoA transferase